ncbi:MAG TPA: hypothetical protein VG275_06670 [Solirubrobacteraceae bacterium]|jgi:hypothetical protein|nr:hypothetical protein [Solirubrobacteraceae bacterium]
MTRRICVLLICALAPIMVLTGCGGSGKTKSGATSGLSLATVKHLNKVNAAQSYTQCQRLLANPGLPANQKTLVQTECEYIRTGNQAGLHQVDVQLCQIEAAAMPEPERTKLQAQCKKL